MSNKFSTSATFKFSFAFVESFEVINYVKLDALRFVYISRRYMCESVTIFVRLCVRYYVPILTYVQSIACVCGEGVM